MTVLAGIQAAARPGDEGVYARGGPLADRAAGPARRAGAALFDRRRRRQPGLRRRLLPRPLRRRAGARRASTRAVDFDWADGAPGPALDDDSLLRALDGRDHARR